MKRIQIRFRGPISEKLKEMTIEFHESPLTVKQVFSSIIQSNNEMAIIWPSPEVLDRDTLILKNGIDIGLLEGLESLTENNDEITILPLIHGG